MADNDDSIVEDSPANLIDDVELAEGAGRSEMPFAEIENVDDPEPTPERVSFISYLTSPMVTLIVGSGETETILTAHQALLTLSPYFKDACAQFSDDGSVSSPFLPIPLL